MLYYLLIGFFKANISTAICRGILGETCDSASVISHPNCRCRGLQIYGKECIEFAFQYSVRCPNCRGNLNDTVLAEQAKEAAKLVYDDQYALLENKLEADYLHLRHKMKKLLRRTKFLKVTRKAHLKHAKTERRKNKSAIKKRALVLYGSTVQAAGWNQDRHVHVFSQEYLYLWQQIMTPALEQLLNWSRVNRSGVSIVEAKVLLHRIDQACRYALNCIHDTLHNTRATKHIEGLLRRCTELLEMYENPNLSNEHALILAEHLKKLCVEIHHPPHISTQTDRKHLIREMETNLWAGNHKLNGNQLKTFRFFHDKSMRPGLDLSREYYLEIMFCGIKNILQNQCLCRYGPTGPSICGLEWLDSLAENCALNIVRTNILSLSQIGDGINVRTPYKEASHLAIWDSIYSVFMLEEELNICRTWKPIGWPEDEELVEDEALYEQNVFDDDEFVMPDIFNEDTHPEDE